ncbi:hypothetical protein [Ammoniphilus sp. CFH 90114]|uniref:hypothetical protein n=1 Tax=Ammoniphilus sp. CFH 90114 TaxID=2493665 RepID=UPI00100F357F|nr:hypothetical protein [Ammoniphilus sp. CFH 90114]RXT07127.1 hypothetical protein EIZ39_13345 [Ammoniphilus sp. CFH 90114]
MSYRCKGPSIKFRNDKTPFGTGSGFSNVVDTAYPLGGIVLPNDEEVIVFLNYATTGGGFMTIGTVISPDHDLITRLRPNGSIRFMAVTVNQAIQARLDKKTQIQRVAEVIKA